MGVCNNCVGYKVFHDMIGVDIFATSFHSNGIYSFGPALEKDGPDLYWR